MVYGLSGRVVDLGLEVRGLGDQYKMATQRGEKSLQVDMHDV